ncbi:GNAT family N-acetyltransferase [Pseudoroseicyclus tamaricis]|uniref:GNAT family N-acetyltransferase n=1 Tax=Pseudoroseicyclus tamaricis TaxID=2705421 RepID=A0A6B2K5F6_9RHOB|nr:GNAT family N-acetyltransferase [Pseudoroseicyclus tamaricis]NDV01996.1 GNAT family N-acetyltransferase [Pseudoroseicyclus tamaricis]
MSAPIRDARPADAAAMAAILGGWVRATPWMPRLHNEAEDRAFCAGLIEQSEVRVTGEPPLGFLSLSGEEIGSLYVAAPARGQGRGRALLSDAKARRARLSLWTFQANEGARRFYRREGFEEAGRTPGDNAEGLPDIRFTWEAPA